MYDPGSVYSLILSVVLLRIDPLLVVGVALTAPPLMLIAKRNSAAAFRFEYETTIANRERLHLQEVLSRRPEAAEVRLYQVGDALRERYERLSDERIEVLARGRCVVVISHRLSTVREADQIAVIDDGCLVQLGRHHELVGEVGSIYETLYEIQASMYQ